MALDRVLDDRQSEPAAARPARACGVGAVEPLEDPVLISSAMPMPRSVTAISTTRSAAFTPTPTLEPGGEYAMALAMRLPTASLSTWASPRTYSPRPPPRITSTPAEAA